VQTPAQPLPTAEMGTAQSTAHVHHLC
jgi:hypothetical protein